MKQRATIVCWRHDRILLVARARSRWSLPGGTIRRSESPREAARRELEEETSLAETELTFLFQFAGFNKVHHVFCVNIRPEESPRPSNEIVQCRWFTPIKIATLSTSVPTRGIVDLVFRRENNRETPLVFTDGLTCAA